MKPLKIYLLTISIVILLGFIVPYLISSDSTDLVLIGIGLLLVAGFFFFYKVYGFFEKKIKGDKNEKIN